MDVELINTGSELLLGKVLNTHQQWLGRRFTELGFQVRRQVAVADTGADIQAAVHEALGRGGLVVTTGGLGPTADDLTRDFLAQLLQRPLVTHTETLTRIRTFFQSRGRPMPERTVIQAQVPEGAMVLPNQNGTAPGLFLDLNPNPLATPRAGLIMLPGPPRELRPMFEAAVVPLLTKYYPRTSRILIRTWRTTGIGESMVEEKLAPVLEPLMQKGLEVGYCSRPGEVDVRFRADGGQAEVLIQSAEAELRRHFDRHIYGSEEDSLEARVVEILRERKRTLALAESCTGGYLGHRITNIPGASEIFKVGFVTYSNEAKQTILGVNPSTLHEHGAVSQAVAREMAEGARRVAATDYALAVTGIAGPSGGTTEKPVGTVCLALAGPDATQAVTRLNPFDRETFKYVTTQQALDMLRMRLAGG